MSRKSSENSSVVYHKAKNPFVATICKNISFRLLSPVDRSPRLPSVPSEISLLPSRAQLVFDTGGSAGVSKDRELSGKNSPLSHGGHVGYDVCTLGMKSRRCVSNLRFAAINHAKQRSFQCALMYPCAQITDQKVN